MIRRLRLLTVVVAAALTVLGGPVANATPVTQQVGASVVVGGQVDASASATTDSHQVAATLLWAYYSATHPDNLQVRFASPEGVSVSYASVYVYNYDVSTGKTQVQHSIYSVGHTRDLYFNRLGPDDNEMWVTIGNRTYTIRS